MNPTPEDTKLTMEKETFELAKVLAPDLDVYDIYDGWSAYCESSSEKPIINSDIEFLKICHSLNQKKITQRAAQKTLS